MDMTPIDSRSGLPDRGSMFHAGLNRLYGCGNTSGRPAVDEEALREFDRFRQERRESMQRRYGAFVTALDRDRRGFPEYADRFDLYEATAADLYNNYMEELPSFTVTNQYEFERMHHRTLTGINQLTNKIVHFIVMVAAPAKQDRQAERDRRAAPGYVPEDESNRMSGGGKEHDDIVTQARAIIEELSSKTPRIISEKSLENAKGDLQWIIENPDANAKDLHDTLEELKNRRNFAQHKEAQMLKQQSMKPQGDSALAYRTYGK